MDDPVIGKTATYEGYCHKDGTSWSGSIVGKNTPNHVYMQCPMGFYINSHNVMLNRIDPPICKHPNKTFDQGSMTGSCPDCGERWAD